MAIPLYHTFTFLSLFSYGLYHLISSTRSFLKPSSSSSPYAARPFHPLSLSSPRHSLRHLPLYLLLLSLLISTIHHSLLLSLPSLQTASSLLFFLLIAISLSLPLSLPPDLIFLLASLAFSFLSLIPSAFHPSDLQHKCDSISSLISASSAAFSLALAVSPRLFLAEFALAGSVSLQGLWSLQTVLLICVERFVPEGCHRLLEVRDGSIRCELEDSRARAGEILDLAFVIYAMFVSVVAVAVYAVFSWGGLGGGGGGGGGGRRYNNGGGSYEALPTSNVNGGVGDLDHVQMKVMAKNSMQA